MTTPGRTMSLDEFLAEEQEVPIPEGRRTLHALADELTGSLLVANDLFRSRFSAPASITLGTGHVVRFRQSRGFDFIEAGQTTPQAFEHAPLAVRIELAASLDAFWQTCEEAQDERIAAVKRAIALAREFITDKGPAPGAPFSSAID